MEDESAEESVAFVAVASSASAKEDILFTCLEQSLFFVIVADCFKASGGCRNVGVHLGKQEVLLERMMIL